jgi:hypothetical protein
MDFRQHPDQARGKASQGSGPGQQFPATGPVQQTLRIRCVQGDAEPGACLVRDGVPGQQGLAQSPVPRLAEMTKRYPGGLAEDPPLLGQEPWDRSVPVLGPGAPPPARSGDRIGPVRKAGRRPGRTTWRETAKRYASERWRITSVIARRSGG